MNHAAVNGTCITPSVIPRSEQNSENEKASDITPNLSLNWMGFLPFQAAGHQVATQKTGGKYHPCDKTVFFPPKTYLRVI